MANRIRVLKAGDRLVSRTGARIVVTPNDGVLKFRLHGEVRYWTRMEGQDGFSSVSIRGVNLHYVRCSKAGRWVA